MSKSNKNSENFTASFTTIKHSTVTDMFTDASNSTSVREDIGANKRIQPLGRDNFDIACAGIGVALIPCIMFGNCLVLIAVYKFKRLQTITNVFVVSLAVADLLISIITLPSYVAFYLFPTELATNKYACLMKFSSVVMLMGSSLINLVFVTIDRYIAIVYPLQYVIFMTMRKTKITVFLIWAYNFTIGLLPFVWNVWTPDSICNFYRVLPKSYTIFTTFFMGGLCLILLCLLYARIFYVKSALTKRQKNFLGSVTSAQFQAKDHKSANLFAVIFFVFLICWIPFLVTGSLNYQSNPEIELIMKIVKNFALLLAMSNSALNPIIYCWIRQEFRKGFRRILCRYNGEKLTPGSSMFSINSMQYKM